MKYIHYVDAIEEKIITNYVIRSKYDKKIVTRVFGKYTKDFGQRKRSYTYIQQGHGEYDAVIGFSKKITNRIILGCTKK